MRLTRFGLLSVVCALAVLAFGTWSPAAWAEPVTIQVAFTDNPDHAEDMQKLVDWFQEEYPNIKVELLPQYRENWDRLAVHIAGGIAPDVIAGYGEFSGHVMTNEVLLDLTPLIERDNLQSLIDDFAPAAIDNFTKNGRIYGFPKYTGVGAMYYNTAMVDEAGLAYPDPDWDWDEFAEYAKKLTEFDGGDVTRYGYNLNPVWTWVNPWFWAAGVDFSDPYRVAFDTPEAWKAGTFLQELYQSGYLLWRFGRFPEEEAAMTSSGSWELAWMTREVPMGLTAMPTGPAGKATQMNNDIMGIHKDTEHPEEAWTFLKWWFSEPVQMEYMRVTGLQPARRSLGFEWLEALKEIMRSNGRVAKGDLEVLLTATDYAKREPLFANPSVVGDHIMLAINMVLRANRPVPATFSEAARVATNVLQQEKKE